MSGGMVPDNGITLDALMNPLRVMITTQVIVPMELDPLSRCLSDIYAMDLQPEYYENAMSGYLMEFRSQRVLNSPQVLNNPAALASHLSQVVETSRANRRVTQNPLLDVQLSDPEEPIPCGIMCIDGPMRGGLGRRRAGIVCGFTGIGKCLGKGTKVLKFDGSIIAVEDIVAGDMLMGPDSKPRMVLSTTRGREEMFLVDQNNGDSFTCNRSHILSLKRTGTSKRSRKTGELVKKKGEVRNMSVDEYLKSKPYIKHQFKAWKTGVEFGDKSLPLDPYILGIWLGDGTSAKPDITTADPEVEQAWRAFADQHHLKVTEYPISGCKTLAISGNYGGAGGEGSEGRADRAQYGENVLRQALQGLGVMGNKHIPDLYLRSSRNQRLQLLAGIVDADGYCPARSTCTITMSNKELSENIVFLARSLGFMCSINEKIVTIKKTGYKGIGWVMTICGDVLSLPTRVPRRRPEGSVQRTQQVNSFKLKSLGEGDYYGFELNGDGLFLLGDFTVTHNTALGLQFALGAARLGFRARLATLELPLSEITQRAYANAARYDYNEIQYGYQSQAATEEEREAEKLEQRMRVQREVADGIQQHMGDTIHNFGIYDFSGDVCTVPALEQMVIDDIQAGHPPDMLVVDWLELLDLPVYNQSMADRKQQVLQLPIRELRHKLEEVTKKLASLAVRRNLAIWILTQADFKAEGQSIIGLANKSEGKGVSRYVSWFLGFGMSAEDQRANDGMGICHCHAGKGRNGRVFTARVARLLHQQRFESMETLEEQAAREEQLLATAGFH